MMNLKKVEFIKYLMFFLKYMLICRLVRYPNTKHKTLSNVNNKYE